MFLGISRGFTWGFNGSFQLQGAAKMAPKLQYNFDNVDDVIQYNAKYWRADAPDFELQFEADLTPSGTLFAQNLSSTSSQREFQLYKVSSGLKLVMGGSLRTIVSDADMLKGFAHWRIVYENGRVKTYKNGTEVKSVTASVGTATEPSATFMIGARKGSGGASYSSYFTGTICNVKMWYSGTSTTGRLLLDSPVDDGPGSTEIKNLGGYGTGTPLNFNDERWEPWADIPGFKPSSLGFPYTFPMTF